MSDDSIDSNRSDDAWYECEAEMRTPISGKGTLCASPTWLNDCEMGADSVILIF